MILIISRILSNISHEYPELPADQKKIMKKFASHFNTVLRETTSIGKKKRAIQTGGFYQQLSRQ